MKIIGHRGACGLAPENTIASLKKAIEHRVDAIEFDLRVTGDGVVVLHHDEDLKDASGSYKISTNTYNLLKEHKADLTTFEEVLDKLGPRALLDVEVKPGVDTVPIIKITRAYFKKGWRPEHFWFCSFDQQVLLELDKALPEITKVVLERWSGVRATHRARQLGTKYIIMKRKWLWPGFIRTMSRSGYILGSYTINDPAKARRWAKYGLQIIVTDYPDLFENFPRG